MPEHFQRPETALKRAEEFLAVQKPKAAQEVLIDVIKNKRHRNWTKIHEEIMDRLIQLNVQLKDSKAAKESLFQYKLICHSVNIKSLEDTVRKHLQLAEARVEQAKADSKKLAVERKKKAGIDTEGEVDDSVLGKIEDLEALLSPEDMMLGAVTGEGAQERADMEILVPWIKFLWDAYRNCLDLLKNNKLVERLYQEIAKLAMEFCVKYDRKNEFRRLCDTIRTHLNNIMRNTKSTNAVNLTHPESQALHLDMRIYQLDIGIKIELWQEAFKAVEDIHFLMNLPKRSPPPKALSEFYQKLGVVFCRASMDLFHSCTQHKLFKLTRDNRKNLSQQELSLLASRMLISTISIPITSVKHGLGKMLDIENALLEKHQKMARLLDLERSPSRSSLMQDMISRYGVLRLVAKPLIKLYNLIETEENTLKMKDEVETILSWIENHESAQMRDLYTMYAPKIRNVMASRILIQVSKLYMTIKFPRLIKLLPGMSREEVERMIVDASRIGQLRVRIDHSKDMIKFGLESDPAPLYVDDVMSIDPLASHRKNNNEWVSNHLNALSRVLEKAIIQLRDDEEIRKAALAKNFNYYIKQSKKQSSILQIRREVIEGRIEACEQEENERVEKIRKKKIDQIEKKRAQELKKQKEIQAMDEAKRKEEEDSAARKQQAQEKLDSFKKTDLGKKLFENLTVEMILDRNMEELFDERVEMLRKSKREDKEKLRKQERNMDYLERAKRQVALPKIDKHIGEEEIKIRELWDKMEDERIMKMREEWKTSRETKKRLSSMSTDAENFKNVLKKERRTQYMEKKTLFDAEVEVERKRRLDERRLARIEQRREEWQEKCREDERKRIEEDKRLKKIEEENQIRAEAERVEAERKREQEEQEKRQKEREEQEAKAVYRPAERWGARGGSPGRGPPGRRVSPGRGSPGRRFSPPRNRSPGRAWGRGPPRRNSPPPRDDRFDRGPRRDPRDRSPPGAWRPPPRDRSPGGFGRRSPPRDDQWRRPASPRRRTPERRRSPPRRSPPRRSSPPRDTWRRGGSPPRRGASPVRRAYSPGRRSPPRRDMDRPTGGGAWRRNDDRGPPPRDDGPRGPPRDRPPPQRNASPPAKQSTDEDGWTTAVDRRKR